MTYDEYEIFIGNYFKKELKKSFKKDIEVKHQENLKTPTGREYNIDLNYTFTIGDTKYLTIIECKNWKVSVNRDIILSLKEKARELGAHKCILVTTVGFQVGAIEYALEHGVGLLKITNTGKKEVYSNFSGEDIEQILLNLVKESVIDFNLKIKESVGVIYPQKSSIEYLEGKYGSEFIKSLFQFKENLDDFDVNELTGNTIDIIRSIPLDWWREYEFIETGGLPLKLLNESETRIDNVLVYLFKSLVDEQPNSL